MGEALENTIRSLPGRAGVEDTLSPPVGAEYSTKADPGLKKDQQQTTTINDRRL